jgi:hypothetical protein
MGKYVILLRSRVDGHVHAVLEPSGRLDEIGTPVLNLVEYPSLKEAEAMIGAIDCIKDDEEQIEDFQIVELRI